MSARCVALAVGVGTYLLVSWLLSGCSLDVPVGEAARYGTVRCSVRYLPPIDLFQRPPNFLPDKP